MSPTAVQTHTVTKANERGIMLDGRFTGTGRWADLDLDALEWQCKKPSWFESAVEELRWARDCGETNVAIMIADTGILMHPYALTMRDAIDDLGGSWEFDTFLNAFKVPHPENYSDMLRDICATYSIATSPRFEDRLVGLDEAVVHTRTTADDALKQGFVVPTGFKSGRELKPHQAEAVLTLAANGGGLLADQVGLGKGGEFVCGLLAQNDWLERQGNEPNYPVVVAVTKSMKLEIAEEIRKWKHDAVVEVLSGTKASSIDPSTEFVLLNHDLLSKRLPDLLEVNPRGFIADEAHVYKNTKAERSKAAIALADQVRANSDTPYIVMASGTPFLNAPKELWALLVILGWSTRFFQAAKAAYEEEHGTTKMRTRIGRRGGFGNKGSGSIQWGERELWPQRAFEVRWCGGAYDKYGAWHDRRATHTSDLNRRLLDAGMVRRRKSDVLHPLPPLNEALFRFDLDADAKSRYDEISDKFRDWLVKEVRKEAEAAGRNPMRAVENAIRKLMSGEDVMRLTKLRSELSTMKVPHTVEWVHRFMNGEMDTDSSDNGRRKLILYVHHKEARQLLLDEPTFAQYSPVHILPGADQKDESIVEHKRRFQADDDVRLIICSMAAREGHTLTAAKDVYLHEMPFVPSWIVQMAGRCWARMSEQFEPHEAYLHYAIADNTIDSMLVRMNAVKKSMFTSVIDGEGQGEGEDDILFGKPTKENDESWQEARERQGSRLLEAFSIGARELGIAK